MKMILILLMAFVVQVQAHAIDDSQRLSRFMSRVLPAASPDAVLNLLTLKPHAILNDLTVRYIDWTGDYWDDSQVPALAIVLGSSAPGLISFATNDTLKIYGFDGAGAADFAYFTVQLSHRYKEGTPVYPHIHWCRTADPGSAALTNVVWRLTYSMAEPFGGFTSGATNTITNAVSSANWVHQINSFAPITNANFAVSSVMVGTIQRVSADAGDTYDQDAGFLGFDIHFLIDSPGSKNETSK